MELGVNKEKLLRTLRSDITGLELRTNHVNMSPFDKSDEGSDESASSSYKGDIVVYTHDVSVTLQCPSCGPGLTSLQFTGHGLLLDQTTRNTARSYEYL